VYKNKVRIILKVVIIDYQVGNINSIVNMLKKLGISAIVSNQSSDLLVADRLILPGVGAFDHGIRNLQALNLDRILYQAVIINKIPLLGICLGMQLLLNASEEGQLAGLGWINGHCRRFNLQQMNASLKIPHMGWNLIQYISSINPSSESQRFYFVHSYHADCDSKYIVATTKYGYNFPAIIKNKHIIGAQFHPEKSHRFGMNFLKSFIESTV
jgi:imidazole glycerol-phosphate synthase subunit HisH